MHYYCEKHMLVGSQQYHKRESLSHDSVTGWSLDPSGANLKGVCEGSSPVSN